MKQKQALEALNLEHETLKGVNETLKKEYLEIVKLQPSGTNPNENKEVDPYAAWKESVLKNA